MSAGRWRDLDGSGGMQPRPACSNELNPSRRRRVARRLVPLVVGPGQLLFGLLVLFRPQSGAAYERMVGAGALLGGLAASYFFLSPRRPDLDAQAAGDRVLLPRQPGFAPAAVLMWTCFAVTCLGFGLEAVATGDTSGRNPQTLVYFAPLAAAFALWVWFNRHRGRGVIRLSPDAIEYAGLHSGARGMEWSDIEEVHLLAPSRRTMVLTSAHGTMTVELLGQAWPARAVAGVVQHYADHPAARADLTDPAAVDRVRAQLG